MLRQGYTSEATVTRPNDTTAYAAGDVVGGVVTFGTIGPPQSTVRILSAELMVNASALISGEAGYTLHLYCTTPPSALADNAAWDLPAGDRDAYLGYVDLGTPVDMGATLWVETHQISKTIKLTGSTVYGYLVTDAGYTPTAERVSKVRLHSVV